jgi:predicted house-cleaning noncanonical NTP pyrophosphatase (MazG superfamily)
MKTRTFRLNKLVRDKIVQDHVREGAQVETRRLSTAEYVIESAKKVIEEVSEGTSLSELADAQEAIAAAQKALTNLIMEQGFTVEQVAEVQIAKKQKNGGFENADFIETETWPADHKWAEYYANEPDRFPEVK